MNAIVQTVAVRRSELGRYEVPDRRLGFPAPWALNTIPERMGVGP